MEPNMKPGQSRKVDPEEAINTMAERAIENSGYQARTESERRDNYPVGRDQSTKEKRVENTIDSNSYIARRQGRKKDWENYVTRNSKSY